MEMGYSTLRPSYPPGSKPKFSFNNRLDGPQNSMEAVETIRLQRPVIEPWSLKLPAKSLFSLY